jgi:hypothetical protein
MIVNAAIFTCSICGEASSNICSYCTKDACSNHRCERCKRCSDCCECEFPLSAEEPLAVDTVTQPALQPEIESAQPEPSAPEAPAPEAESNLRIFLTAAESSVFVKGSVLPESTNPIDATNLHEPIDPGHQSEPDE